MKEKLFEYHILNYTCIKVWLLQLSKKNISKSVLCSATDGFWRFANLLFFMKNFPSEICIGCKVWFWNYMSRHVFKMDELGSEIAQIALPAALALTADPIASLVDTAFIGQIGTFFALYVWACGNWGRDGSLFWAFIFWRKIWLLYIWYTSLKDHFSC